MYTSQTILYVCFTTLKSSDYLMISGTEMMKDILRARLLRFFWKAVCTQLANEFNWNAIAIIDSDLKLEYEAAIM